jgi:predicted transcriptional regulator
MANQAQIKLNTTTSIKAATVPLAFRLKASVVGALDNIAKNQNLDRSDVIRQAVYRDLKATYGIEIQGGEVVG